jgi:hypothetical protein
MREKFEFYGDENEDDEIEDSTNPYKNFTLEELADKVWELEKILQSMKNSISAASVASSYSKPPSSPQY